MWSSLASLPSDSRDTIFERVLVRKPSRLLGEMAIDDVADDGFEDGVSEKLESLIVERLVAEFFRSILL